MAATTKRDLVKRISAETNTPRPVVRQIVQQMLDDIVDELAQGHRLEFRDFGVFETVKRKPRVARNPRTGLAVHVPAKVVAHFKQGRIMRQRVAALGEKTDPPAAEEPAPASAEQESVEPPGLP
jgi:nucleoid DNA-binding protein